MDGNDVMQTLENKSPDTVCEWGREGFNVYDSPIKAMLYGRVTSPQYLGHDKWIEWMKVHYIAKNIHDSNRG